MMRFFIVLLMLATAQVAIAQQGNFFQYFRTFQGEKIVANGVFQEKTPSIPEIQSALSTFSNDADFLAYLLASYPHLKNNFVLVHKSESQQLSTLTHPRIIFFGGGSAFAFSESTLQRDRRVEILTADPKTFEVSLHEITFEQGRARLESNPQSCMACHGSPSRALWNPYDFWPNTFGSAIGNYGTKGEAEAYSSLRKSAPSSQLLSQLNLPEKYGLEHESVTSFTIYMSGLNQGRWIAANLKKGSAFDKIAKPFIAAAGGCISGGGNYAAKPSVESMKHYMGSADVSRSIATLPVFIKDQLQARNHFKTYLDQQLQSIFPNPDYLMKVDHSRLEDEAYWVAYMRWVLSLADIDGRDLSSSLIGNDTLMSSPGHFMAEFTTALYEIRPDLFKDFKIRVHDFAPQRSVVMPDCKSLLAAIKKETPAPSTESHFVPFQEDAAIRPVLSRCSKCHSEGLGNSVLAAPYLPFSEPQTLAALLRSPQSGLREKIEQRVRSSGPDQMPPSSKLSEEEITSLLSFLDNIK